MRFIITSRRDDANSGPASDAPFDEKVFTAFMKYNEDLHRAGVLVASEGLTAGRRARASSPRAAAAR